MQRNTDLTISPRTEGRVEHRIQQQEIAWIIGGIERLVSHYGTDRNKAFLHPVRTIQNEVLTDLEPADHPWHRGLWFAWKYLNGDNFWEERNDDEHYGRTEYAGLDTLIYQEQQTQYTAQYNYLDEDERLLMREQRALTINFPTEGPCIIDWDTTFTAWNQPVHFSCTPITPETWWGGYAGLSFRAAPTWTDVQGLDSEGRNNLDIKNQRASWVRMAGQTAQGHHASVAILDHPANPRYPTYWYYSDAADQLGFAYMNPSLVFAEPYDLVSEDRLRLRYRILVADGVLSANTINDYHAALMASK